MKKKKTTRIKRIKQAIGRLHTPPPQIIQDKRGKLREKIEDKEIRLEPGAEGLSS